MFRVKHTKLTSVSSNEQGFASLVIALTLIVIMALITVGFAQLARREQVQALNKHLAVQANYAAESAVNDATDDIQDGNLTYAQTTSPNCLDPTTLTGDNLGTPVVDAGLAVSYNCVLVNEQPQDLIYGPVKPDDGHSVAVTAGTAGQTFSTITVEWGSADQTPQTVFWNNGMSAANFLPASQWNMAKHPPMLELSLTGLSNGFSRSTLINNSSTNYLYPYSNSVGKGSILGSDQAKLVGSCTSSSGYVCSATLKHLSQSSYLIHFLDYYDTANVLIKCTYAPPSTVPCTFKGGQAIVDATGKAQDVLKRLQVRVPLSGGADKLPNLGLEAGSICKRIETYPGSAVYINGDGSQAQKTDTPLSPCFLDNNPITVPPPGGGGGGGDNGVSDVGTSACNGSDSCQSNNGGANGNYVGGYNWKPQLYNKSYGNTETITGCDWNFGDGVTLKYRAGNPDIAVCQPLPTTDTDPQLGDPGVIVHDYSTGPYAAQIAAFEIAHPFPDACSSNGINLSSDNMYPDVTLTLYFSDGTQQPSIPTYLAIPYCHM